MNMAKITIHTTERYEHQNIVHQGSILLIRLNTSAAATVNKGTICPTNHTFLGVRGTFKWPRMQMCQ
jgi:hypothetical protein